MLLFVVLFLQTQPHRGWLRLSVAMCVVLKKCLEKMMMSGWEIGGWSEQEGCADVGEGEARDMSWMVTPPSISRCQYGHLRGWALLIDAPVRQRAAGAWRRPSISSPAYISLSPSVYTPLSFPLALHPFPSVQPHLSFSFTSTFLLPLLSSPQHSLYAANHSNIVPDSYFSPFLLPKIFISLFISTPLASQEVRETTYKSDPAGSLGLMEKRWDVLLPPLFTDIVLPSSTQICPSLPPSFLVFASYHHSQAVMCGAQRLNMGNKLLNKMLLHMYKHPQCEHSVSTHTLHHSTQRAYTHTHRYLQIETGMHTVVICILMHIHITCPYRPIFVLQMLFHIHILHFTYLDIKCMVEITYKWFNSEVLQFY